MNNFYDFKCKEKGRRTEEESFVTLPYTYLQPQTISDQHNRDFILHYFHKRTVRTRYGYEVDRKLFESRIVNDTAYLSS